MKYEYDEAEHDYKLRDRRKARKQKLTLRNWVELEDEPDDYKQQRKKVKRYEYSS